MQKKSSENTPKDFRCALRVKIKNLAHEATLIRREERKTGSLAQYEFLRNHRVNIVRHHARLSQIAMGAIKGKPYGRVETRGKSIRPKRPITFIDIKAIAKMVFTYGSLKDFNELGRDSNPILRWIQNENTSLMEIMNAPVPAV